jgi:sugar lactone lactonase YvrE
MAGSRLTPLLDGGRYFEAPRWHDHRLWLVDSVARMIMDKVGRTYVGDLGFDLKSGIKNRPYGRIILVEAGREPRVVADGLNFPNGIAISDDGRQLVVAETNGDCLASFTSAPTDRLLDENSFVRVATDGRVLDRISVPGRRGVACVLGGEDRKTLFCVSIEPGQGSESGSKSRSCVDAAVVEVPGAGYP